MNKMKRGDIELDYGYSEHKPNPLGCTVYIDCKSNSKGLLVGGRKVMDKGVVLDSVWWERKVQKGKHIHKKKIIL